MSHGAQGYSPWNDFATLHDNGHRPGIPDVVQRIRIEDDHIRLSTGAECSNGLIDVEPCGSASRRHSEYLGWRNAGTHEELEFLMKAQAWDHVDVAAIGTGVDRHASGLRNANNVFGERVTLVERLCECGV